MKKLLTFGLILALLTLAAGCKKDQASRDQQAIRAAMQKYLAERGTLNLDAMEMDVKQATVTGDTAEAQVEFRAKQGGAGMQMSYKLQRQGDHWVVTGSQATGMGMAHPPLGQATPSTPPSGQLPAGHPPITEPGKAPAGPAKKN